MNIQKRKRKSGTAYIIQFTLNKKRRALYLPKGYNERQARRALDAIQETLDAINAGRAVDAQTWLYLNNLPDDLRERFERAGLIETPDIVTAQEVFNACLKQSNKDFKAATVSQKIWTIEKLSQYIDLKTPFESIDAGPIIEAEREKLAPASLATFIRSIKTIGNWAVDKGLCAVSPFARLKSTTVINKAREYFIDRETAARILEVGNSQERALFAVYRYGGLRRAEALLLQFKDVDYKANTLHITSPKTANKGKAERVIPLFPELRQELINLTGASDDFIFQFAGYHAFRIISRLITRAGLTVWPRIIQNLRASRAVEIEKSFGAIVEAEWLGHTPKTAAAHYLHSTPADFERAVKGF